ncbi:hypothetical protein GGTG_01738 [Gaeumannomyces tritici R3-111a-1]|uniref:Uncharacterized protein n=1 Tax=Gaeumannomyces tritici (strain R3-111a-1) TaxID=644352 RepID=J3NKE9_GAET3|nr:hypothetical protein GGTG_01738 [Gaeumannomyces tritici R3-111a-1]EJT81763.1 hypothetical protein GGTG_01738 [Gaeumannomyces tritici R3-111a-1]
MWLQQCGSFRVGNEHGYEELGDKELLRPARRTGSGLCEGGLSLTRDHMPNATVSSWYHRDGH